MATKSITKKTTVKKVETKKVTPKYTISKNLTKEAKIIDLSKAPIGTKLVIKFPNSSVVGRRRPTEGRLYKQCSLIYFCSNNPSFDGSNCENKLGYKYSHNLDTLDKVIAWQLSKVLVILSAELDPKFIAPKVFKLNGRIVEFNKNGSLTIGCTTVSKETLKNIFNELYKKK